MKVTMITGATGGLGREFCKLYAQDKNNLFLVATNDEKLALLKEEIEKTYGVFVDTKKADLSKKEECDKVVAYVKEKGYFVNNLVNNAGFGNQSDFKDMDLELQIKMLGVNCMSLLHFTRSFIGEMLEKNEGRIINVGSIASFMPGPYMSTYHASKAFVLYLSEAIAHEVRKSKVRVTTLCPGPFDSGFVGTAGNEYTFSIIKTCPAEKVAKYAYKKSKKGKRIAVVGFKNKLMVFAPRLFSRKFVTTVTGSLGKKGG